MPPRIPIVIGILAWCFLDFTNARASTRVRLPMPTSETIPYVAEVMGATSYEESIEEDGGEVKRVQRKLTGAEHKEPDLDQDEQYAEYQGVIGRPGVDFPVLPSIPRTDFSCKKVKSSGYYADLETGCQVFHICDGGRKISFLCPNGTIFRQSHLICDWWFRVDCAKSEELYEESAEQLAHDQMIYKKRAEEIAKAMTAKPSFVSTEPTRTISYDQRQLRRRPQPEEQGESSELERQVPAETASFASNRHRFSNQIENQYRQYLSSTSTSTSTPVNVDQSTFNYNYQQSQKSPEIKNYNNNAQNQYPNDQNYPNLNGNGDTLKVKANYQAPNQNNFPSLAINYASTTDNSYPSTSSSNYPSVPNTNFQNANNYNPAPNNNYQSSNDYNPNSNNDYQKTNNYNPVSNNDFQKNNNYNPVPNNDFQKTNYNPVPNNDFQKTNNYNPPPSGNYQNNYNPQPPSNVNYYNSNNNNYPGSASSNNPSSNINPTTSSYRYQNRDYQNQDQNKYNSPVGNNAQSFTVSNYSISTANNKNSQSNNNKYPSRGNANYFSNNNNYSSNSDFKVSTSSPSTKPPSTFKSYNYSTSERGSVSYRKSESYSEYTNSESPRSESGRIKPSNNNDNFPTASTTIRSVTNKVASYNDHTPQYEKYTSSGVKQKSIFNVKIKPTKDTKDFAYVELLRHDDKTRNSERTTSESPVNNAASSSPSSEKYRQQTSPESRIITTVPPPVTPTSSRNTYLPKQTTVSQKINVKVNPIINRYASINISGTAEEIRPEIVNALMESGVTPTSAKALHSLASYISSGAAEADYANVYTDGNHPHVSDVILNFRSGTSVSKTYPSSEATTATTITSSGQNLPSVLTKATKESYSYLFSDSNEQIDFGRVEQKPKPTTASTTTQKPKTTSQSPQDVKTTTLKQELLKGDLKLKDSTELRELAQVFSRALSAYLEDPETFKEILAQVRPTEPNVDNTTPSIEDEVLDFSDAMLGRLGTTISPITTIGQFDYNDENVNIGEINSLAGASKTYEADNSLESNTFPPTAPEASQEKSSTSISPKLLLFINNTADDSVYFRKLGSAEDQSYFPTLGGVSDTSRPRYGGFQNNTGKILKPYGAEVPRNVTGAPLSSTPSTNSPNTDSLVYEKSYNSSNDETIPEPHIVNSLIKNNVLNSDHSGSDETFGNYQTAYSVGAENSFYPTGEQEKLLVTSGSQSIVSSNNYVEFAKKFNEQQSQLKGKEYNNQVYKANSFSSPGQPSLSGGTASNEDLSPYFGQEPPLENLARPSGFKSPAITIINNEPSNQNNSSSKNYYSSSDPINYHIGNINEELATPAPIHVSSQDYDVTYNDYNTGSEVSSSEYKSSTPSPSASYDQPSWTVSPLYDVTSSGTIHQFNYTQQPLSINSHQASPKYQPTTYHPPHSRESLEVTDSQWETTYNTDGNPSGETTPSYDYLNGAGTTLSFDDQYKNFEEAAKEMFGMLNETAAATLMDMMAKGESNMTIRRLVLLLVNNHAKENNTAQDSRESLINALLTNAEEIMHSTLAPATSSSTTLSQAPRKKVLISRTRVSSTPAPAQTEQRRGKSYRGIDSMTAIHGNSPSPSEINKINSAKLYIPSPSNEPLTNKLPLDSDARAVELLKTLYSLAAKWG